MNTFPKLAISTSSFMYTMDRELVENTFVSPGMGPVIPADSVTNNAMAEFLKKVASAVNKNPIDYVECYYSSVLDRHLLADVFLSNFEKPFWSVHGPYGRYQDTSSPVASSRNTAIKYYKEAIKLAKTLGAKVIVIHPGHKTAHDVPRKVRLKHSIDSICQIADFAGEYDIIPAVEPMPNDEIGCTLEEVLHIIEKADRPNLCVNFDTNHLFPAASIPPQIRQLKGKIGSIHISDQDDVERHWLPFQGILDWPEVINALSEAEYEGPLVYETHVKNVSSTSEVAKAVADNYVQLAAAYNNSVYATK